MYASYCNSQAILYDRDQTIITSASKQYILSLIHIVDSDMMTALSRKKKEPSDIK